MISNGMGEAITRRQPRPASSCCLSVMLELPPIATTAILFYSPIQASKTMITRKKILPPLVASASIILSKFVLADEIFQHAIKIRPSNLLQVVIDACAGLVDLDESTQVDGRADDHCIALGVVNRGL